jgi:hypothetical protein
MSIRQVLTFLFCLVLITNAGAQTSKPTTKAVTPTAKPAAKPQTRRQVDLSKEPTLYVVGYAHLDTEWRW